MFHFILHVDQPAGHHACVPYHDTGNEQRRTTAHCEKSDHYLISYPDRIHFSGQFLFKFFGISTNGFRIAAGFIIIKIGYDMLQARYTNVKLKNEEIRTYANDISITPLSIPMLCGPGAIANGIMLMDESTSWSMVAILVGIIALVYLLTYFILKESTRLVDLIGETGNNVMMRLMGLILMVIAVECFVSGARPILIDIIQSSLPDMLPAGAAH